MILHEVFDWIVHPKLLEAPGPLYEVSAKSAVIMDAESGAVLWSRDAHTPRYPASTTKIMTCLLMLEQYSPDDKIIAPPDVTTIREASLNLRPGESVTVPDMAYALMLRSANDACYAVAVQMDGSVAAFSDRMNARAAEIGCQNTHFNNPNGLNDPDHVTSAYDLCLIAREAMKREDFRKVVKTRTKVIARSINQLDRSLKNRNKLLWKDPRFDGIKTGFTNPSGYTFVGSATQNGIHVITAVMDAPNWQADEVMMVNYAFKTFRPVLIKRAGALGPDDLGPEAQRAGCRLCIDRDFRMLTPASDPDPVLTFELAKDAKRPFKSGDTVGTWRATTSSGAVAQIPVKAASDEPPPALPAPIDRAAGLAGPVLVATGALLGLGTLWIRGKKRALR